MPYGRLTRAARAGAAALLLAASAVPAFAGRAAGGESLSDLRARMSSIQADLDATTAELEDLRDESERLELRIDATRSRIATLQKKNEKLRREAIKRARALYIAGGSQMLEALFGSGDFSEIADRARMLSQVSLDDASVFVRLSRSRAELEKLEGELLSDRRALEATADKLADKADALQAKFEAAQDTYDKLKDRLAAATVQSSAVATPLRATGGMTCPVAGPVSFTDTWGDPRSGGRGHQGVDFMAAYGTPVVAITSGTITLSSYGSSAGYWQVLSGDDGNQYWYMHNQRNIVNGGHVSTGQQIATVGDTGNAAGTPHLHFEYHPGGGAAVNPYPLAASVCG